MCESFLIAGFLTGAVISWGHELGEWLTSHLFENHCHGEPLPVLKLVDIVEQSDPHARGQFVSDEHGERPQYGNLGGCEV